MNVLEELKEKRSVKKQENNDILDSAVKLLTADAGRERLILKDMGLDHNIVQLEKLKEEEIEIKALESKGHTFHEKEIKEMAVKYGLRLLPSAFFKGDIDLEMASKARRYMDEHEGGYNAYIAQNNFYILAPIEFFQLEQIPKPKPIPKVHEDPILFYRPNNNQDYYTVVYKWGEDFTFKRRLIGFSTARPENMLLMQLGVAFLLGLVVFGLTSLFLTMSLLVSTIIGSLAFVLFSSLGIVNTDYTYYSNETQWNSKFHNNR